MGISNFFSKTLVCLKKSPKIFISRYIKKDAETIGAIPLEQRFHNRFWEWHLGVDTIGIVDVEIEDGLRYEPTPYLLIEDILNRLQLNKDDVFVDLGCGKGRSLVMAARRNIKQVIGVEYDNSFLEVARNNIEKLANKKAVVKFENCMAQEFDYDNVTIIYLYNPFGADTLKQVLKVVKESIDSHPRKLRVVYINPQHDDVIESQPWLEKYDCWKVEQYPDFYVYPVQPIAVSFWQTI